MVPHADISVAWRSMHPCYPVATPGQVTTYSIVTTTLQCQNCLSFPAASAHHPLSKRLHLQPRFLQLHIGKSHRKSRCPNGSSSPNGSSMEKAPVPDFQSQSSRNRHQEQPPPPKATPPKATPSHRHHRLYQPPSQQRGVGGTWSKCSIPSHIPAHPYRPGTTMSSVVLHGEVSK